MSDASKTLISQSEVEKSPVDVIGDTLDNCRSWQLKAILIIYHTKIPAAFFMACIIYTSPSPQRVQVFCKDANATGRALTNFTSIMHPPVVSVHDKEFDLNYCDTFSDIEEHARRYYGNRKFEMPWIVPNKTEMDMDNNLDLLPCDVFNVKSGKSVTTYDIICSRSGLVVLTQGMHIFGLFLSGIFGRYLMKVVSPKNLMRIAMISQIVFGNLAGLAESYIVHLICRASTAIGCAAAFSAGASILADITRGELRIAALIFFDVFWSIGIIIMSLITELEARWTELYVIISYPTLLIIVLSFWIPDSPRWLLRHGEVQETLKILTDATTSFGSTAIRSKNIESRLREQATNMLKEPPPVRWSNLWQGSALITFRLIAVHVAFVCFTIMYFGMALNMSNYGRKNLPSSARFLALSEVIGCYFGYLLATKTKRKFQWSGVTNILGAIIAFCIWFWRSREAEFAQNGILLCFSLLLKASVSCSFGILSACSTDLVENEKKSTLMFSSVLCGRFWLLNAPVIVSLGTLYGEYLSLTIFASTGVIGGLAMILIDFSMRF